MNDLSSALRRRFNTVVLPLPATDDDEVDIVARRVDAARPGARAARGPVGVDEIRRVVTIFRELAVGDDRRRADQG